MCHVGQGKEQAEKKADALAEVPVCVGDMAHVQHVVETHLLVKNHVSCWSGKGAS